MTRAATIATVLAALSLALVGCDGDAAIDSGTAPAAPDPPPELTDEDAAALPLDRLRAAEPPPALPLDRRPPPEDPWAARADATADGIAAARRAASLARVRAWREPEGDGLDRARALLREASLRRTASGACDASLDLARLEARDAHAPETAYLVAYRTARRFRDPRDEACAIEARRVLGALDGYRADRALLAAIDADPDADDPSVGLAGDPVPGAREPDDDLAAFLAARATGDTPATISSIVTYGGSEPDARGVRVVIAVDRVVRFERLDLDAEGGLPARTALDLAGAAASPDLPAAIPIGRAGLERIRHAPRDGGTRVVLDLAPGAEARVFLLPEPFRIVIDVLRDGAGTGVGGRGRAGAPRRDVDLVVLDPGHGGNDYGARAFGMQEADVVLDLALRAREVLRRRLPDVQVVLTRETDTLITLEQRTAMANAVDADAFVSIHLNAAWEEVDHGGVTTFVLDTTNDRQALRLAARENGTTTAAVGDLSRILAGFRREEQVEASRALAERIHLGTLTGGRTVLRSLYDRGVRSAMFYVLVGATMPAVLVEASFMTRADEGAALRTERYRQALADGIAEGIARWVEGR